MKEQPMNTGAKGIGTEEGVRGIQNPALTLAQAGVDKNLAKRAALNYIPPQGQALPNDRLRLSNKFNGRGLRSDFAPSCRRVSSLA